MKIDLVLLKILGKSRSSSSEEFSSDELLEELVWEFLRSFELISRLFNKLFKSGKVGNKSLKRPPLSVVVGGVEKSGVVTSLLKIDLVRLKSLGNSCSSSEEFSSDELLLLAEGLGDEEELAFEFFRSFELISRLFNRLFKSGKSGNKLLRRPPLSVVMGGVEKSGVVKESSVVTESGVVTSLLKIELVLLKSIGRWPFLSSDESPLSSELLELLLEELEFLRSCELISRLNKLSTSGNKLFRSPLSSVVVGGRVGVVNELSSVI